MAQKSDGTDVKAISMKLQSLLQIPSTEKVDDGANRSLPLPAGNSHMRPGLTAQVNVDQRGIAKNIVPSSVDPRVEYRMNQTVERSVPMSQDKTRGLEQSYAQSNLPSRPRLGSMETVRILTETFSAYMNAEPIAVSLPLNKKQNELTPVKQLVNTIPAQLNSKTETSITQGMLELASNRIGNKTTLNTAYPNTRREFQRIPPIYLQMIEKVECPHDVKENLTLFIDVNDDGRKTVMNYFSTLDGRVKQIFTNHMIDTLNKKSVKFPRAKFYCVVCNYHMDSIYSSLNHIVQERHFYQEKFRKLERSIKLIPKATKEHTDWLSNTIFDIAFEHGLTVEHKSRRQFVLFLVLDAVRESGIGCDVNLFGSSVSGFGFRTSDVNINIGFGCEALPWSDTDSESSQRPSGPSVDTISFIMKALEYVPEIKEMKESYSSQKCVVNFDFLKEKDSEVLKCTIQFTNISAVWLSRLFDEYDKVNCRVKPLVLAFRYFAKICEIDNQDNGLLPPHCYTIMVIHYLQEVGVIPVLHCIPTLDQKQNRPFATAAEAKPRWYSRNTMDVGQLWIGLLRYYSIEFDYKDRVVTISRTEVLKRTEKHWNRRLSIEDPIIPHSNVARSATSNKVCDYIIDRIKVAYLYFATPRTLKGPMYLGIAEKNIVSVENTFTRTVLCPNDDRPMEIIDANSTQEEILGSNTFNPPGISKARMVWIANHAGYNEEFVLKKDANILHMCLRKLDYYYTFNKTIFWDGTSPPLVCKSCGFEGHVRKHCPEETIPPLLPVRHPSLESLARLRTVIYNNFNFEALTHDDFLVRMKIAEEIQSLLCRLYPDVQLTLFGSSQNRFGLHNSDLDVCMTFQGLAVPPGGSPLQHINVNEVLMNVVGALKSSGRMNEIVPITSAKVPIVKFRHKVFKLEGDISLYNILAVHNTRLLKAYADLDPRVGVLGCFLKKLGKICDISDASKASLSSYGYILMLIHFLQRHPVPVLPVLQEIAPINHPPGYALPLRIVDSVNTYFFEDVARIVSGEVWGGYGRNSDSVEKLWLSFLRYYTEVFNYDEDVVTISQSEVLTRRSKSWFSESMAIEDPFDKTHNLGAGLSRRMSVHIIKTLQRFRIHFNSFTEYVQPHLSYAWYMDVCKLRHGDPPIDRQCRLCNRIGHFARSCTYFGKQESNSVENEDEDVDSNSPKLDHGSDNVAQSEPVGRRMSDTIADSYGTEHREMQMNSFQAPAFPFGHAIRAFENIQFARNGFSPSVVYPYSAMGSIRNSEFIDPNEDPRMVLSGFTFFWNMGEFPRTAEEYRLYEMVKSSRGVTFSNYVLNKAKVVSTHGLANSRGHSASNAGTEATPSQDFVILNNGVNGHGPNHMYLCSGVVMQLPEHSPKPVVFAPGTFVPPQYAGILNGYARGNGDRQESESVSPAPLPPPPGFPKMFPQL